MDPVTVSFATTIAQLILTDAIPLARQLVALVHKPEPTLSDWNSMLDLAESEAKKTLDDLAKQGIKPEVQTA